MVFRQVFTNGNLGGVGGVGGVGGGRRGIRRRFRPAFMEPLPPGVPYSTSTSLMSYCNDVGYIGYLTDVENDVVDHGGFSSIRRELLALDSDFSFTCSVCLFIGVCFLFGLLLFLIAASPLGISPPSY